MIESFHSGPWRPFLHRQKVTKVTASSRLGNRPLRALNATG